MGSSDSATQPPGPLEIPSDYGDYIKAVEHVRERVAAEQEKFSDRLPMWVVFGPGTTDQSELFVTRLWLALPELTYTSLLVRAGTLQEIRDLLPDGLVLLPRQSDDDPNIIETWI